MASLMELELDLQVRAKATKAQP